MKILYYLGITLLFTIFFAGLCSDPSKHYEITVINQTGYKIILDFKYSENDTIRRCNRIYGGVPPFSTHIFEEYDDPFEWKLQHGGLQLFIIPDSIETSVYCGREDQWRWIVGRREYTLEQLKSLNWTIVVE